APRLASFSRSAATGDARIARPASAAAGARPSGPPVCGPVGGCGGSDCGWAIGCCVGDWIPPFGIFGGENAVAGGPRSWSSAARGFDSESVAVAPQSIGRWLSLEYLNDATLPREQR